MNSFTKNALVLGLLSAVGPFAIDMYLPALPAIAADLHASTLATQMTLLSFFVAFGLCQIVYGPVSDMVGRKPPLYVGLTLFTIGSIGCGLAPSIEALVAARFVQGLGAASVMVIPRAIIRDMHTGIEATRLMSLIMLVISVSPILAPLAGSALIAPFGWRAVFAAVTCVALVGLFLLAFAQTETHAPENRMRVRVGAVLAGFSHLMRDPRFLGLTFVGGLGMASFFAFIANASFVYIDHFGLTPTRFSLLFAVNAVGFIGASQFATVLGARFGMAQVVTGALVFYAVFALVLLGATVAGVDRLDVLVVLLFLAFANLGLVIPTTMVLALEDHGPVAGLGAGRHAADGDRRRDDRPVGPVLRRYGAADGRRHRRLRGGGAAAGAGDAETERGAEPGGMNAVITPVAGPRPDRWRSRASAPAIPAGRRCRSSRCANCRRSRGRTSRTDRSARRSGLRCGNLR